MRSIRTPQTRRLRARPADRTGAADLLVLYGDERIADWLWPGDLGGVRTAQQVERMLHHDELQWRRDGFGPWLFHDTESGAIAGRGGLRRDAWNGRPEVELLYAVRPDRWRRGYATEIVALALEVAFERLELESIIALVLPANHASRAVLARAGFEREAEVEHAGLPHVLMRRCATSAGTP